MLAAKISEDTVAAVKGGDSLRVSVLRMLSSELNYKKIELQRELTDEDVVAVIGREVKKRQEAVVSYQAGGRQEQMEQELKEKEILLKYLPELLSEEDVRSQILDAGYLENIHDFGQAMKIISPMFKWKADGGVVAKIVRELVG